MSRTSSSLNRLSARVSSLIFVRFTLGDPEDEEVEEEDGELGVLSNVSSLTIRVDVAENVRQDSQPSMRACGTVRFL
jgi:hypothetical protein